MMNCWRTLNRDAVEVEKTWPIDVLVYQQKNTNKEREEEEEGFKRNHL